jgi:hypothetical protein
MGVACGGTADAGKSSGGLLGFRTSAGSLHVTSVMLKIFWGCFI